MPIRNYGWAGTILDVDLSSGRIERRPLEESLRRQYLGGRGINSRILYNEVRPGTDPYSPENLLIFGTGPLGGTIAPSANKLNVTAKSPLTNGVGTSNAGGKFVPELKWAGYDHILIRGKAQEPVYLWIDDDSVELRSAKHLWGKTVWEADRMIRKELGDSEIKVAAIGPAGERLVRFSCIIFTLYRAAGQTGMGAVMGSKNLKAVAVRGTKSIEVAKPELFKRLVQEITRKIMAHPSYPFFSVHGTPGFIRAFNEMGLLPVRNFQQTGGWEGAEKLGPEVLFPYYTRDKACYSCPVHCSHFFEVKEGAYKGEKGGGIEANQTFFWGAMLGNTDPSSLFKCVNLCNQYGMDSTELSLVISSATEWYEKGLITKKDTDGIVLEWGRPEAFVEMIHKIGKREGIGDLLAEGGVHAAEKIGKGAGDYITYCRGMMGGGDVRAAKNIALNMATGTIPYKYEEGVPSDVPELTKAIFGREKVSIPLLTIFVQNICKIADTIEICKFVSGWATQEIRFKEAADLFSAATGMEVDCEALELVAERIHDLERAFAVREGMTRKDDHLHGKIMKEPVQEGPHKGERMDPEELEAQLDEYYKLRGWDKETGIPTRAKLEKVGLKDVAEELERVASRRIRSDSLPRRRDGEAAGWRRDE